MQNNNNKQISLWGGGLLSPNEQSPRQKYRHDSL